MGKIDTALKINGILLVNKPKGLSSNAVLQKIKRLYNARKAGHTGSLDPLATGMLPICFGEATKFSQYLLEADKTYEAIGKLGIKTSTSDAEGEIIAEKHDFVVTEDELRRVLEGFIGSSLQVPSMFSALKHQGRPLYELARQGISIERPAREITIDQLELLAFNGQEFSIRVSCSKGTYIRNLVEDIGEKLGTYAYVKQLHRNFCFGFSKEPMYDFDTLIAMTDADRLQCILPLEAAIINFPMLYLSDEQVQTLQHGKELNFMSASVSEGLIRMYDAKNIFIGLGELYDQSILKVKRLLSR